MTMNAQKLGYVLRIARGFVLALGGVIFAFYARGSVDGAKPTATRERIGIYDSRIVAYAHFWSEAHQRGLNERIAAAKTAKENGQLDVFDKLDVALKESQRRVHLQVFSTAAIDDVLADMADQVRLVQKEADVTRLISKWDETAMRECASAEKIDVTMMLVRNFPLGEKQKKVIQEMRKKEPIPLSHAKAMEEPGKR